MKNLKKLLMKDARRAAQQDAVLRSELTHSMPGNLLDNVVFLRLEGHTLRVTVTSAAWASRVRFSSATLLDAARKFDPEACGLSVHVEPETGSQPAQRDTQRSATLPASGTVEQLKTLARHTNDDDLGNALNRLASTLSKKPAKP